MAFCGSCGNAVGDTAKHCGHCGQAIPLREREPSIGENPGSSAPAIITSVPLYIPDQFTTQPIVAQGGNKAAGDSLGPVAVGRPQPARQSASRATLVIGACAGALVIAGVALFGPKLLNRDDSVPAVASDPVVKATGSTPGGEVTPTGGRNTKATTTAGGSPVTPGGFTVHTVTPTSNAASVTTPSAVSKTFADSATFTYFGVSLTGTAPTLASVTAHVRVCLITPFSEYADGTTPVSWAAWSARDTSGTVVKPDESLAGQAGAYPKKTVLSRGNCAEGNLRFVAPAGKEIVSIEYLNSKKEAKSFYPR